MLAIVVAPYLKTKTPPTSDMLKFVVESCATVPFAFPVPPFAAAKIPEKLMLGVVPPEEANGEDAVTLVIVPPEPVAEIVWLGQVPEIDTPEPATNAGVAVAVPPLAIGRIPVTPVVNGSPVAFVKVPDAGVPRAGVTSVGELDNTTFPEPVEVVTPVPPEATGNVPVVKADVLVA
jgi:hypothetical protein